MKFKHLAIIIVSVLAALIFVQAAIAKEEAKIIDGNKAIKGQKAPRFEVSTLDGEKFNLEDSLGKKPIVISFWATWCEPCKKELPYVQKFYEKYSDSVDVIAISIDTLKNKKVLTNTVKELGLKFPIGMDPDNKLRQKIYISDKVPFLVVIDKSGKVLLLKQGCPEPEKVAKELEDLLKDQIKPNK
jgi:peroxiredoxin